jgi:hypothetical protein
MSKPCDHCPFRTDIVKQPQSSPGQRSIFDALDAAAPPRSV